MDTASMSNIIELVGVISFIFLYMMFVWWLYTRVWFWFLMVSISSLVCSSLTVKAVLAADWQGAVVFSFNSITCFMLALLMLHIMEHKDVYWAQLHIPIKIPWIRKLILQFRGHHT